GTPSGRDLESLAFDQAWLPTRGRAEAAVRKTFPVARRLGHATRGFFLSARFGAAKAASMVQYFTKGFFDEIASRLNTDSEWGKKAAGITANVVLTCSDRNAAFLADIQAVRVAVHEVPTDLPELFKFEGTYHPWAQHGKGDMDIHELV